ncbi:hypothetical protein [Spongiimicrobium salis]|uniref:hypothetical protein n=1 Tax=Spongiimicrobium salis TaxID=1667022 RepID=UPI00374DA756
MKIKLQDELIRLCTDIITSRELNDIDDLYEKAKGLYEKLAVLRFIDKNLKDIEIDVSKNAIASKFEKLANAVMNENTSVPETNPHEEDIITPGIDTIKDMVSEMPLSNEAGNVFAEFMAKPSVIKEDKEVVTPEISEKQEQPQSLNDRLTSKEIKVDLNDRLAFVKHLFNNSTEDYNRVISQLSTIDTEERSVAFITNMIKPDYNNWTGKEEYESRFMALIQRKFS